MGVDLAADVTVSHFSQANPSLNASGEDNASVRAANRAANAKVVKHGPACRAQGVDFLPLAVCSFGGWLPEGEKFVRKVAERLAEKSGMDRSVVASQLWQRLSLTL